MNGSIEAAVISMVFFGLEIHVTDRTPGQSPIVIRRSGVESVSGWQLLTAGLSRCVPEGESEHWRSPTRARVREQRWRSGGPPKQSPSEGPEDPSGVQRENLGSSGPRPKGLRGRTKSELGKDLGAQGQETSSSRDKQNSTGNSTRNSKMAILVLRYNEYKMAP